MKPTLYYQTIKTPLGEMIAAASEKGLCLLEFYDNKSTKQKLNDLTKQWNVTLIKKKNKHLESTLKEIELYFNKKLKKFSVTLDTRGTEFQTKVWKSLIKIPYGSTWSYLDQSKKINKPTAVRAVASANGKNKIAIIIPCHRVIGKNGSLTGYAAGIERKKYLLELENAL